MSKQCPNCGAEQPDEAKFCESCGGSMGMQNGSSRQSDSFSEQGGVYSTGVEKRDVAKAVIFSIITCGIYAIYWMIKITDEIHALAGEQNTASGGMAFVFSLITCGIYGCYWMYKMGEGVNMAQQKRGMTVENNASIMYIVLTVCGFGIVSYALMQSSVNKIIDFDGQHSY